MDECIESEPQTVGTHWAGTAWLCPEGWRYAVDSNDGPEQRGQPWWHGVQMIDSHFERVSKRAYFQRVAGKTWVGLAPLTMSP